MNNKNPFLNNTPSFVNNQPTLGSFLNNKTQNNSVINTINNSSKNDIKNPIFNPKIEINPFDSKNEPNFNNLNNNINKNESRQNTQNSFFLLKTQENNNIKTSTNININQNINNNSIVQNSTNIFNKSKGISKPLESDKSNTKSIFPVITDKQIKKEEKKEEPFIALTQSNNIFNKSKNDDQNQKSLQKENKNQPVISIPVKNENSRVNEYIHNLFEEDKIIYSEEQKKEYEKKQLSLKSNDEIIEEFKSSLINQKEIFSKCINNARLFDNKFINLIDNIKKNSYETINNEIRYRKLSEKIKLAEENYNNLKLNMTNKNEAINGGLDYLKKNLNNNNFSLNKNKNYDEKNKFYYELSETSDKIRQIEDNTKRFWNSINSNNDNMNQVSSYNHKEYGFFNNIGINNDNPNGIFIERNNINNDIVNKIYVEPKDINNMFIECYDGLNCLKCLQDELNTKYNSLKNKLIDKIKENNNTEKRNIQEQDLNL